MKTSTKTAAPLGKWTRAELPVIGWREGVGLPEFGVEVNSSPGLEGIEHCTQLDIAGAMID